MKTFKYNVIAAFTFLFLLNVNALEYKEMELIPVDTVATVRSENFDYVDFSYSSILNEKGDATVNFTSINNKSSENLFVSIDILLFDGEKKNIGFLTYCSDKDYSSEYADIKLNAGQSMPFKINVSAKKYFAEEKYPQDVKYIAVMDDNKYCHIGGYTKYAGLTLEEIEDGQLNRQKTQAETLSEFYEFLHGNGIIAIIVILIVIITIYSIYGAILNALNKRMFGETTVLAYVPIANLYLTVKLAFGKLPATIFLIAYFVAIPLSVVGIGFLIYGVLGLVNSIAFFLIIIKLITKRYDLLYHEPKVKNPGYGMQNNYEVSGSNSNGFGFSQPDINQNSNSQTVQSSNTNNTEQSLLDDSDNNLVNFSQNNSNNQTNNSNEEGSDLTKFFN